MSLVTWNAMFNVGIKKIDDDHLELVRLINKAYDESRGDNSEQAIKTSVAELINYTKKHFGMEESLMTTHKYPRAADHRAEHTKLIAAIEAFSRKINNGVDRAMISQHMSFLKEWLFDHIMKVDKDFGKHLKSKNVT